MGEEQNIAVFADFENIAIGVREARFDDFDIHLVMERLLDKGRVLIRRAYADWERYRTYCRPMHEVAFELIEVPHLSYSGKNSADIQLVVDALDLCYTKSHIDTFVILSGDSDFSPLVKKLRENNKQVIGIGVKKSSSDLLVKICDEFIYYDDLIRRSSKKKGRRRSGRSTKPSPTKETPQPQKESSAQSVQGQAPPSDQEKANPQPLGSVDELMDYMLDTTENLLQERDGHLWGSIVKQTIKRKRPNFDESYYGFRSFSDLLKEAERRNYIEIQRDEKSGSYIILGFGPDA